MKFIFYFLIFIILISCKTKPQKTVIAHRGASGYLPEHTLEAKKMAHKMSAHFLEQDLVLSKDDVPIVIHDIYLDEVTNVAEKYPKRRRKDSRFYVVDFTFDELKTLQVKERFHRKTKKKVYPNRYQGNQIFRLHSLKEEIELIKKLNNSTNKNVGIYPEIKHPAFHRENGKDISKIVLKILSDYGYTTKKDPCILQCFDAKELERIRTELQSDLFLVQLMEHPEEAQQLKHFATYADGIGPWYKLILADKVEGKFTFTSLVKDAHDLNLIVHPFTFRADSLDEFDSFKQMIEVILYQANSDGGFTDFPDKMIEALINQY